MVELPPLLPLLPPPRHMLPLLLPPRLMLPLLLPPRLMLPLLPLQLRHTPRLEP